MTATRLRYSERDVLDALDRAIKPLDEAASMNTLNDNLLDLIVDEMLPDDDPARLLGVDNWLALLDVSTPDAYETAMLIDDCHQAGHHWHSIADNLAARWDAKRSQEEVGSHAA